MQRKDEENRWKAREKLSRSLKRRKQIGSNCRERKGWKKGAS
jgi:hypothetical protein